jgi:hypothetical protein
MSEVDDLREVVEELRAERFPELPAALVAEILGIEAEHVEDRGPAPRLVEALIDGHLEDA